MKAREMRALYGRLLGASIALLVLAGLGSATPALAGTPWRLDANSAPTDLHESEQAREIATASNVGESEINGSGPRPVEITDKLPAGLKVPATVTASAIEGVLEEYEISEAASKLECTIEEASRREVTCRTTSANPALTPYAGMRMTIPVEVLTGASSGEADTVSVIGGESANGEEVPAPAPITRPITVEDGPTPFGIERYELAPEEASGSADVLAGSHPYQLTTTLDLNETLAAESEEDPKLLPSAPALPKNLSFELPPGLLGDPQAIPQCSDVDFATIAANDVNACPADTAIGVALVTLNLPSPPRGVFTEAVPVFNLVPAPGEPARFGIEDTKVPVILDTSVRSGGDYGVDVAVRNTSQLGGLLDTRVTLWGQPDNESHDASRGWACLRKAEVNGETCSPPAQRSSTPFLTLPTACIGALATRLSGEAWNGETASAQYVLQAGPGEMLARLQGCEGLPFSPAIAVAPVEEHEGEDPGAPTTTASTPAGLNVSLALPAEDNGLGESAVRATTVTLPAGVMLSPSAANGLQACSESEIGYEGAAGEPDPLAPGTPQPMRFSTAPVQCPEASKVGIVHIESPDLAHELEGGVYLAQQTANPFGSLFALYIAAEDPVSRILVKLAGEVTLDESTGQITSTFADTPQVPFERLSLHLFEGPRASVSTPASCGYYTTDSAFTPWSGGAPAEPSASFNITAAPEGGPCSTPLPLDPSFQAGATNLQAGAFTSFALTVAHRDGDEPLAGLTVHLPTGVAAMLSSVTPCRTPAAGEEWACGSESLIGSSLALAGLGPDPYPLPGRLFLTEGYGGAPFGLLVQTPAVAGPFNLGNVNVRSKINIDPHTAQVTITSDSIPTMLKGVPAQIKNLDVAVDRPNFEFNPTSCEPKRIEATVTGSQGASESASSPFQVSGCQSLPFTPTLTATTQGKASKADGASLDVRVTSGAGQANIAKTVLSLPTALPSRLTTIQKACEAPVFEANPASCAEGSVIGHATVYTPVLKSPLTGPAYLVSHGGADWPDVEFVLQGEGITLILDGQTQIKNGITTSSFNAVPDAPVSSFEAILPQGPHSALTANLPARANYDLCGSKLAIPTTITAQNAAVITQDTKVTILGCGAVASSKAKKLTSTQKLADALHACRKRYEHSHARRVSCEKQAHRHYAAEKTAHKANTTPHRNKRP